MTNRQEEAARKRIKRTLDTVEAERARQEDTARHRQLRDQETFDERTLRQEQDMNRHSQARQQETFDERTLRQEQDAVHHRQLRDQETLEQRTARQEQDAARHSQQHAQVNPDTRRSYVRHPRGLALKPLDPENMPPVSDVGAMVEQCRKCRALYFSGEKVGSHCCLGKITLPDLLPYPEELVDLMTGESADSTNFRRNIRKYNSSMALASMGGTALDRIPGRGPKGVKLCRYSKG